MFWEHYKPPKWTWSSQRCNKGCDFPFRWEGGREGGRGAGGKCDDLPRWKIRAEPLQLLDSFSLSCCSPPLSPPSSFPSPEALSGWAIGSIPANWGQRRIKLRSYGLIYTSISVDRRGNRILRRLILLGFLCTANIVWSVILKSSQLLSAALLRDFGYSLRTKRINGFWQPISLSFFFLLFF